MNIVRRRVAVRSPRSVVLNYGSFMLLRQFSSRGMKWQNSVDRSPEPKDAKDLELRSDPPIRPSATQRVTYEYPPTPRPGPRKPLESGSFLQKHWKALAAVFGGAWAIYVFKYFFAAGDGADATYLSEDCFSTFKITFKETIADNMQVIELSPNYKVYKDWSKKNGSIWNGKVLWSIEVVQPDISVVRKYTPLPMYYMQYKDNESGEVKGLLRLLGDDEDEGRFVLLVKRYEDGEVSRWLTNQPVGATIKVRGPLKSYRFPYEPADKLLAREPMQDLPSRMLPEYDLPKDVAKPSNLVFFAGGTGIAPVLQSLFSHNPPRAMVDVHYSVRTAQEQPFKRFMYFLEKAGRARFHYYVDDQQQMIGINDIPVPGKPEAIALSEEEIAHEVKIHKIMEELKEMEDSTDEEPVGPRRKYRSVLEQVAATPPDLRPPVVAVVCGPPGYVRYLSGFGREIGGLLGQKGWTKENTKRMEC